jgi:hypothetical protein
MGNGCIATLSLTTALDGDDWSASHSGRFPPGEISPSTHWIGVRAGLVWTVWRREKFCPAGESNPGLLARNPVAIPTPVPLNSPL